ncbi:MAG TPA: DUF1009 domain-containing protein, partial [Opitutae bacterium]|nr:DUF1009 domain-containing protein [Opitutae bacterium]
MATRWVPQGFDATRPVAIIAGRGRYPALMVEQARAQGIPVRLIAFKDETDPTLLASFPADQCQEIEVGKLGAMLTALKELGAAGAVMAGQITPRKLF